MAKTFGFDEDEFEDDFDENVAELELDEEEV